MEKTVVKVRKKPVIYDAGKPWSKMTVVEKRKTLAQDVILQTKAKFINPTQGEYCNLNVDTDNLQKDLQQKGACDVCAMGSLMVASIIKTNKFYGSWTDDNIVDRLEKVFSEGHLRLIECAFEGKIIAGAGVLYNDENEAIVDRAYDLNNKYFSEDTRLIAIMRNIIKDPNGKFLGCKF